jgi:hypothetical protein
VVGIEDGDPKILDRLPASPLSGESADGLTPDDVIRDVEAGAEIVVSDEERDDVLSAFEDGFHQGVAAEVVHSAMAHVGEGVR